MSLDRLALKNMVNYSKNHAIKNKTERKMTRWGFCVEKFVQFCKRTDLHGYKYIVMEDLSILSRSIWAIAVVVSIIFAAICVVEAYQWYARNPIVTVIESTQGAIWDIPFPAVTVCDLNVISRRAAKAFSNNVIMRVGVFPAVSLRAALGFLTYQCIIWEIRRLQIIRGMKERVLKVHRRLPLAFGCIYRHWLLRTLPLNVTSDFVFKTLRFAPILHSQSYADDNQKRDLHKLQDVLDLNDISIESLFKQLSPASPCSHLLDRCMWKTTLYRCEQLFQPIMLSYTLCCSFNYYAVTNDIINNGLIQMTSPRRVASCGYQTALTVMLRTDQADYYSSTVASLGALVFIDDAYNWPDLDSPVRMVNPTSEVLIALSPERTYATPGIKTFSPEQRQCYYNDEVKIGDFNQYSFHNCMAMQKVEVLKKYCECVPFYFPTKENYRICNFHDVHCMENVFRHTARDDMSDGFNPKLLCLPECEHYDYKLEVALGKLSKNSPLSGLPFYENINLENRSVLNVFFNDLVSTRYRRDVYLNWQNILAAFGGLLSLILGFTLISGFDFIMFFILQVTYECVSKIFPRNNNKQKSKVINVREKTVKFGATSYGVRSNFGSRQVYRTRY